MNASAKRTLRLGLTAGLSLGAIVGIVGCEEHLDDAEAASAAAIESDNGFSVNGFSANGFSVNGFSANGFSANGFSANGFSLNGFSANGFSVNGFSANGFSANGFSVNGLATTGGLSNTTGLMTTAGGREVVKYMVKCAFPSGHNLTKQDQYGNSYTFEGALGAAPELESGVCDLACQERTSAAMLAHVNNSGLHVGIWLVGPDSGIGWGSSPNYPYQEGAYFGNMFVANPRGNYCAGKNLGAGAAKGRMGSPFANSAMLNSPYGWQWDGVTNQTVPVFCANGSNNYCNVQNEGFSSCQDSSPQSPYTQGHAWTHVVTVWRNFEATQLYKICNKNGKCLGVVGGSMTDGANVEQRTYSSGLGQSWQILQVSGNQYKIVNRTSGMALDLNGSQLVQRAYNGGNSQLMPLTYIVSDPGRANMKMVSITNGALLMPQNNSYNDGALVQAVTGFPGDSGSPDGARWSFEPIGLATFDPGRYNRLIPQHATNKSIDVCNAGTTNGTCVQTWDTWNGDPQKFIVADAGNGNVRFKMRLNPNKCIGPRANGTTPGTIMEVQDCNGSFNQAWMTSEQGAGSGIFAYRNAAAPALCLDVWGAGTGNGAAINMYTCSGANNQLFKVLAQ